jgi:hypothetical protein
VAKSSFVLALVIFSTALAARELTAGAWTLKKGQLWLKSSLFYQKTDERYFSRNTPCPGGHDCTESGQRVPFPFGGESRFTAIFWDLNYGLTDRLELKLQVPFFDIAFSDLANPDRPTTSDIGDLRFGLKYRVLAKPLVASFRIQAKAPTGFFNKEAEVVPVGDGQWDLEFWGQFAKSLWPLAGYLNLDLGYRIRFEPSESTSSKKPGNEFFFRGEGGHNVLKTLLIKLAVEGFSSTRFREGDLTILDSERRVLYLEPGVYWLVAGPLAFEASIRLSVSGKNVPAGQIYNTGLSYTFSFLN